MNYQIFTLITFTVLAGVTFIMADAVTGFTVKIDQDFEVVYTDGLPLKDTTAYVICDVKNNGDFEKDAVVKSAIWDEDMNVEYYYKTVRINAGETSRVLFHFNIENSVMNYSPKRVLCSIE